MHSRFAGHSLRLALAGLATLPALASVGSTHAASRPAAHTRMTTVTFRLHAAARPTPGTTFWVAYGPLDDQWGIVRLLPQGNRLYTASRTLPADERTTFSYLMSSGVVRTRFGPEPQGPVVTVRRVGPITAARAARATVEWHPAAG